MKGMVLRAMLFILFLNEKTLWIIERQAGYGIITENKDDLEG